MCTAGAATLYGQLGDGTNETRRRPTPVPGLADVHLLRTGAHQTTAILSDGTAHGWGREGGDQPILWPACADPRVRHPSGRRGAVYVTGPEEPFCPRPAAIAELTDVAGFVSSSLHACALLRGGQVWCWGSDAYGSLGDPAEGDQARPVQVAFDGPAPNPGEPAPAPTSR
jgi:alpha-tubulin suppressor-like RCC1 family protein